ncbi:MAG: hypothetical protein KGL39_53310 [Patescibacteria group bacterium]|nr:hypothetical protein [Patescibacteria group bacterium]
MPFKPGQSGNPGGRPKGGHDVRELARSHGPDAIKTLAAIMCSEDAPPNARASAACALLDRGYGKPDQTVNLNDKRDAADWTRAELVAFLHDAGKSSERAATANGRGDKPDQIH